MNRQSGFGMLGLMSMIVLVGTLTAAVSLSSMRSAQGSIKGIHRLQMQAAVEGAAVLVASGDLPTSGSVDIGNCRIHIATADSPNPTDNLTSASQVRLTADLLVRNRPLTSRSYMATVASPGGRVLVEALP